MKSWISYLWSLNAKNTIWWQGRDHSGWIYVIGKLVTTLELPGDVPMFILTFLVFPINNDEIIHHFDGDFIGFELLNIEVDFEFVLRIGQVGHCWGSLSPRLQVQVVVWRAGQSARSQQVVVENSQPEILVEDAGRGQVIKQTQVQWYDRHSVNKKNLRRVLQQVYLVPIVRKSSYIPT